MFGLLAQMEGNEAARQVEEAADQATEWLSGNLMLVILVVIAVIAFVVVRRVLFRGNRVAGKQAPDLAINVMSLGTEGPPPGPPTLEFYNVPVRLVAVAVAPAGRVRELPPVNQMGDIFDSVVPGLAAVVQMHKPLVRRWPPQMSTRGFAHLFFQHARLPGEAGKGTPWSAAAGMMKIEGQPLMIGLVFRTETPTSHAQEVVDSEERWMALLQVKGA